MTRVDQRSPRRTATNCTVAALVVIGATLTPARAHGATTIRPPEPIRAEVQHIPLAAVATDRSKPNPTLAAPERPSERNPRNGNRLSAPATVLATAAVETDPFRIAAVTWSDAKPGADVRLRLRTRVGTGWGSWAELRDDGHGPDPDSAEAAGDRFGTEPLLVPESDAVQVRVTTADGSMPTGLRLELVASSESATDSSIAAASVPSSSPAGRPYIFTRAHWGADESLREPGEPDYGVIRGAFVHHTAGTNAYDRDEVPAIIRAIYAYHVNGRGWRDIGYNFLVDKFGRIWEGRYGGGHRPVIGAHTANYNGSSVGVAALGTFTSVIPNSSMLTSFARIFAWKFGINGVNPTGMVAYPGAETLPAISGHRDATATACPGEQLYLRLKTIRGLTADRLEPVPSTLRLAGPAVAPIGSTPEFSVSWRIGSTKVSGDVSLQRTSGDGWVHVRTIQVSGDATFRTRVDRSATYRLRANAGRPPVLPVTSNLVRVTATTSAADS
jgi:hypothetical protein